MKIKVNTADQLPVGYEFQLVSTLRCKVKLDRRIEHCNARIFAAVCNTTEQSKEEPLITLKIPKRMWTSDNEKSRVTEWHLKFLGIENNFEPIGKRGKDHD